MRGSRVVVALAVVALFMLPSSAAAAHDPIFVVTPSENGLKTLNLSTGSVQTVEENSPIMFVGPDGARVENIDLEVFTRKDNGYSPVELRVDGGIHLLSHPGLLLGQVSAPGYSRTGFIAVVENKAGGEEKTEFGTIKAESPLDVGEVATFRALNEDGNGMDGVEMVLEDLDAERYGRQRGSNPLSAYVPSKDFSVTAYRDRKLGARQFDLGGKENKEGGFPLLPTITLTGLAVALVGVIYWKRPSKPNVPEKSDIPWKWTVIIIIGAIGAWLLL